MLPVPSFEKKKLSSGGGGVSPTLDHHYLMFAFNKLVKEAPSLCLSAGSTGGPRLTTAVEPNVFVAKQDSG